MRPAGLGEQHIEKVRDMKYQIIVQTSEIMSDEEVLERAKSAWIPKHLVVVSAMSLDGIREEVYDPLSDLM